MIHISTWTVGLFAENPYLLSCADTKQAIMIDPGDDGPLLWQAVVDQGVTLQAIVLTHAHLDHVGAVEFLRRRAGIPVYLHEDDAPLLAAVRQQARLFGLDAAPVAPAERTLAAGDCSRWASFSSGFCILPATPPAACACIAHKRMC